MSKTNESKPEETIINTKQNNSGRWWEFYFVRYFVGTVFGTMLVIFLIRDSRSSVGELVSTMLYQDLFKDLGGNNIWIFVLVGLAFCYLASAPVLVLHGFRASLFCLDKAITSFDKERKTINTLKSILLVGPIMFLLIMTGYNWCYNYRYYFWILLFIIIVQTAMIIINIFTASTFKYYDNLCKNRSKQTIENFEFIESYKHLREHGNAFMIILMEILLTMILYGINNLQLLFLVILEWVFPASLVWLLGTILEYSKEVKNNA